MFVKTRVPAETMLRHGLIFGKALQDLTLDDDVSISSKIPQATATRTVKPPCPDHSACRIHSLPALAPYFPNHRSGPETSHKVLTARFR